MLPALLIRLRPVSPFRFGPASGARDRTDLILHSDSVFAAVSLAMRQLGRMPEWLAATAGSATPAVRIGSLFPYAGNRLFAIPPRTLWPPQSTRLRAKSVRFLPLEAIMTLANGGGLSEDRWMVDAASQCLLPIERNQPLAAPFRVNLRRFAAVDRQVQGNIDLHATACLEFAEGAGLWCLVTFQDDAAKSEWAPAVEAAFRLLGDSGIGGERSAGWGRFTCTAEAPEFPNLAAKANGEPAWWTLSLFSPSASDAIDWERGSYLLIERNGRVDATGDLKLASRMVEEGAVLVAGSMPAGTAQDVAPEGSPHPVYRAGFAVALPIRYTPPRAPFLAPELKAAEPAPAPVVEAVPPPVAEPEPAPEPEAAAVPEPEPVAETEHTPEPERTPELLTAAPEHAAIEAAPEPLQLPEPPKPVDPWGWEPQDGPAEEPPRTDDEEPKGGQV